MSLHLVPHFAKVGRLGAGNTASGKQTDRQTLRKFVHALPKLLFIIADISFAKRPFYGVIFFLTVLDNHTLPRSEQVKDRKSSSWFYSNSENLLQARKEWA